MGRDTALSPSELRVLVLIAEALSDKEIAAKLGRSLDTIKSHGVKIKRKLGLNNRVAMARKVTTRLLTGYTCECQEQWESNHLCRCCTAAVMSQVSNAIPSDARYCVDRGLESKLDIEGHVIKMREPLTTGQWQFWRRVRSDENPELWTWVRADDF